jgi:hypothetical protein
MRRTLFVGLCSLLLACADDTESTSADGGGTSGGPVSPSTTETPAGTATGSTTTDADSSSTEDDGSTTTSSDASATDSGSAEESSSGGETTGGALPRGQWAMTEITYTEGGSTETLTMQDRAFCDATLAGGVLLLRYQQAQGYTVWTINIPMASGVGSHTLTQDFSGVYMNINEVSDTWMAYFDPSMAFGTLELTAAQIQDGGVVQGTLTASLTSNDGTTTAEFSSTFYAEIP